MTDLTDNLGESPAKAVEAVSPKEKAPKCAHCKEPQRRTKKLIQGELRLAWVCINRACPSTKVW